MHKFFTHFRIALFSIFVLSISSAQYTEVINSNRPSQSIGAFSLGTNVYQLEQGISFRHGTFNSFNNASYSGFGTRLQLRAGILKEQLEVLGAVDYQFDELKYQLAGSNITNKRKGVRDLSVGTKYLVYDPFRNTEKYKPNLYSYHANNRIRWRDLIPAVSVYAGAQFSTGGTYPYQEAFYTLVNQNYQPITEPAVSVTGLLILQQHLKPGLVLVHNVGMRYITADIQQKKLIGTLTYSTREKWSIFGEYQIDDSPLYRDVTLGTGIAYLLTNDLQLDLAVQHSIKTTPKLLTAGIGVSFRIDNHSIFAEPPQDLEEIKQSRKDRKNLFKKGKLLKKTEKRNMKGLRKLDKKQKRIERKLNKMR